MKSGGGICRGWISGSPNISHPSTAASHQANFLVGGLALSPICDPCTLHVLFRQGRSSEFLPHDPRALVCPPTPAPARTRTYNYLHPFAPLRSLSYPHACITSHNIRLTVQSEASGDEGHDHRMRTWHFRIEHPPPTVTPALPRSSAGCLIVRDFRATLFLLAQYTHPSRVAVLVTWPRVKPERPERSEPPPGST